MKILLRLQTWQTTLLQHPLPIRTVLFRRLATIPGARGETGIKEVEVEAAAEAEAKAGRIGVEERALALRTQGNVTRSAIWAEASICT
jgi:hypothetical protein